jgi:lysophospholipase
MPEPFSDAPFLADVAEGPEGGRAVWTQAADGTRLRIGVWPGGAKGTVVMLPGRTEYIEKYGRVAADFAAAGYAMAAIDWRGQGLSDRPQHRRDMGHVVSFDEYREDVTALVDVLIRLNLPRPWHMLAHSMGGCIGLRALHDGAPVATAAFSAPMWGIKMTPFLKSISTIVLGLAEPLGLDTAFAPTTGPYAPMAFDDNPLTADRDQFDYMMRQTQMHPELTLGGPSVRWVKAALEECAALMEMAPPDLPALAMVGTRERVVEIGAIEARAASWPSCDLLVVEGAEHELLMETPERRARAFEAVLRLFQNAKAV